MSRSESERKPKRKRAQTGEGFLMLREKEVREMTDRVFTQEITALRAQRIFTYLLAEAPKYETHPKGDVEVKLQHVVTGRYELAKTLNCMPDDVKYILKRLRQAGELSIETNHKYSDIWIIHYWNYVKGRPKDSLPSKGLYRNSDGGLGMPGDTGFPEKPIIPYPTSTAKPTITGVSGDGGEKIPTHLYDNPPMNENEVKGAHAPGDDRETQGPGQNLDEAKRDVEDVFGQAEMAERANPFPPLWEIFPEKDIQEHFTRLDAEEAEADDSEES